MKKKSLNKPGMKINGNSFLLMVTVLLFIVMYAAGMVIFADKGFAKPQMFLNLFISNAGLLVIAMGQTIVMITGGIDISVGSVTALVCMLCAYDMEKKGMSAYMAVAIALLIGLLFGIVQGFLVSYLEIQPFIVSLAGMFFGRGMTSIISTDMISIKNKTFLAWANYKIYLPIGSYSRRGKFIPAYIYPTVIIAILIFIVVLDGLLAGCGGFLFCLNSCSGFVEQAKGLEMDAISASVIGVTLLSGGVGTPFGTVFGVLIKGTISSLITTQGTLSSWWVRIALSALLCFFIVLRALSCMTSVTCRCLFVFFLK
jgi:ribose/xylose/arabinose/galactoside ABC-type transport system permease subunit